MQILLWTPLVVLILTEFQLIDCFTLQPQRHTTDNPTDVVGGPVHKTLGIREFVFIWWSLCLIEPK
jgi:hypothetical protein